MSPPLLLTVYCSKLSLSKGEVKLVVLELLTAAHNRLAQWPVHLQIREQVPEKGGGTTFDIKTCTCA